MCIKYLYSISTDKIKAPENKRYLSKIWYFEYLEVFRYFLKIENLKCLSNALTFQKLALYRDKGYSV